MSEHEAQSKDGAKPKLAKISKNIWDIVPNIEDFDRLQYVLRPYVMRMPVANYQSKSLHTDAHGFRRLVTDDGVIGFDQFRDAPSPKGVLFGDSITFGYGLDDEETLHAQLSRNSTNPALWYSLASPVANIFQSRLLLELFLPANVNNVVVLVSGTAPMIYLLSPFDTKPYLTLFGQSTDAMFNVGAVTAKATPRFTLASGIKINDPQTAFQNALEEVRKNIQLMVVHLCALTSARLLVCFKPSPLWIKKALAPQEQEMMDLFAQKHETHVALNSDPELLPYWMQYIRSVETACQELGCDFMDLNKIDALKAPECLFFDQFHLNANGIAHVAQKVSEWAN